jgi:hypothetical protein
MTFSPGNFDQRADELAQRMIDSADGALDLASLRNRDRIRAQLPQSQKRARRGFDRGGTPTPKEVLEVLGAMGEMFVYRQLRTQFNDFDGTAWRSKSKRRFGLADDGDDQLGYDFEYRDSTGDLTGRSDNPVCRIEVKTTTGDGSQPFEMSANEWEVAQNCHDNPDSGLYLIIRVVQITTKPRIGDVLIDPLHLYAIGKINYAKTDLLIYVGALQQPLGNPYHVLAVARQTTEQGGSRKLN